MRNPTSRELYKACRFAFGTTEDKSTGWPYLGWKPEIPRTPTSGPHPPPCVCQSDESVQISLFRIENDCVRLHQRLKFITCITCLQAFVKWWNFTGSGCKRKSAVAFTISPKEESLESTMLCLKGHLFLKTSKKGQTFRKANCVFAVKRKG